MFVDEAAVGVCSAANGTILGDKFVAISLVLRLACRARIAYAGTLRTGPSTGSVTGATIAAIRRDFGLPWTTLDAGYLGAASPRTVRTASACVATVGCNLGLTFS